MKLYATTTSERASKGQGGNKYINFELTAGENQTVMLYGQLVHEETETEHIYRLWNGDICVDTLREPKSNANKKKDEDYLSYCNNCENDTYTDEMGTCRNCRHDK